MNRGHARFRSEQARFFRASGPTATPIAVEVPLCAVHHPGLSSYCGAARSQISALNQFENTTLQFSNQAVSIHSPVPYCDRLAGATLCAVRTPSRRRTGPNSTPIESTLQCSNTAVSKHSRMALLLRRFQLCLERLRLVQRLPQLLVDRGTREFRLP